MSYSYGELIDLHKSMRNIGATELPLDQWSKLMSRQTGSDMFLAGENDNWIKRASNAIDQTLEATRLPAATERFGRAVGSAFGAEDKGGEIGRQIPRMTLDFLPLFIPGVGPGYTAARLGGTALLSGAGAYTATDSPAAGLIAGGVNAAMPSVARFAEQAAVKGLGGRVLQGPTTDMLGRTGQVNEILPMNRLQGAGGIAAGETAASVWGEVGAAGQALASGQEYSLDPIDIALDMTLGQVPFGAVYMTKAGRTQFGGKTAKREAEKLDANIKVTRARQVLAEKKRRDEENLETSPLPRVVEREDAPDVDADSMEILARIRKERAELDPEADGYADRVEYLDAREDIEMARSQRDQTVLGEMETETSERVNLVGDLHWENPKTGFRIIKVADDPNNIDAGYQPGELVGYSTRYEPGVRKDDLTGKNLYSVPLRFSSKVKDNYAKTEQEETQVEDTTQPDLPRGEAVTPKFDHVKVLEDVHMMLDGAQNTEEFRLARQQANFALVEAGFAPMTDGRVQKYQDKFNTSQKEAIKGILSKATKNAKRQATVKAEAESELAAATKFLETLYAEREKPEAERDPVLVELLPEFVKVKNALNTKAGRRQAIADTNLIDRFLYRAYADPLVPNEKIMQAVQTQIDETVRTGRGLPKDSRKDTRDADEVVQEFESVAKLHQVLEDPLIRSKPLEGLDDYETDAKRFAILYDELGESLWKDKFTETDIQDVNDILTHVGVKFGANSEFNLWRSSELFKAWVSGIENWKSPVRGLNFKDFELEAGEGFHWSLRDIRDIQGFMDRRPMLVKRFVNAAGIAGPVPPVELEVMKTLAPEAFERGKDRAGNETDFVNVRKLYELLATRKPIVKLTYGQEGEVSEAKAELDQLTHEWFDNLTSEERNQLSVLSAKLPDERRHHFISKDDFYYQTALRWLKLTDEVRDRAQKGPYASEFYNIISPTEYPVLRIDLALPETEPPLWRQDDIHENVPNTFGWAMVQVVPGPDGKNVMVVGEQQSRWGQQRRDEERAGRFDRVSPHPFLDIQHTLILKAVIAEARKQGIEEVFISDGETAMMTQQHDMHASAAATRVFDNATEAEAWAKELDGRVEFTAPATYKVVSDARQPEQAGGMNLHYNTRLPSAMRKLVGGQVQTKIQPTLKSGLQFNYGSDISVADSSFSSVSDVRFDSITLSHTPTNSKLSFSLFKSPVSGKVEHIKIGRADTPETSRRQGGATELLRALTKFADQTNLPIYSGWTNEMSKGLVEKVGFRKARSAWDLPLAERAGKQFPEEDADFVYDPRSITSFQRGERVDLGVHKNAKDGSPVFRNPDGTPKSSVTGLSFNISGVRDKFSIGHPARALEDSPVFVPRKKHEKDLVETYGRTGESVIAALKKSSSGFIKDLAESLETLPAALRQIHFGWGESSYVNINHDGRVSMLVGSQYLAADSISRELSVMHELVHGLTLATLRNPQNIESRTELTGLRNQVVEKLTPRLREVFQGMQESDWISRYQRSRTKSERENLHAELGEVSRAELEVLYGLSDVEEFVTQGLTSKAFRTVLEGIKVQGQGTSLKTRFHTWIRRLLGMGEKIDNTAFDSFLEKTDRLLTRQEALMSTKEYAKEYFLKQGMDEAAAEDYAMKSAGLVSGSQYGMSVDDVFDRIGILPSDSVEIAFREQAAGKVLDDPELRPLYDEVGLDPTPDGLNKFLDDVVRGRVKDLELTLDVLPQEVNNLLFARALDQGQVLRAANNAVGQSLVDGVDRQVRFALADANVRVKDILDLAQKHVEAEQMLLGLQRMDPQKLINDLQFRGLPEGQEKFVVEGEKGFRAWLRKFIETPSQLAARVPELAEAMGLGYQLQANGRIMLGQTLKIFGMDPKTGAITHDTVKAASKVFKDKKLNRLADKWVYWNQEIAKREDNRGVTMLPETHPKIQELRRKVSESEWELVRDIVQRRGISIRQLQDQILQTLKQEAATYGANLILRTEGRKVADSLKVSTRLFDALSAELGDPQMDAIVRAKVQEVQQAVQPETFNALMEMYEGQIERFRAHEQYFKDNPEWASAQRTERYLVRFKRSGRVFNLQASSKKEAEELAKGGTELKLERNDKFDNETPDLGIESSKVANRLRELDNNLANWLLGKGLIDQATAEDIRNRMGTGAQFGREQVAHQSIPNFTPPARLLSQGAAELPWMWNHLTWAQRQSNYWSRRLFRAQMDMYLNDPEISQSKEYTDLVKTHRNNMLQQDPIVAQRMSRFFVSWFLGFAPASAMVNGTQTMLTNVAEITRLTGRPLESYKRVFGATKDLAAYTRDRKFDDPELQWVMEQSALDGEFGLSMWDESALAQEAVVTNHKREMMRHKPQTLGQRLGNFAGSASNVSMMLFKSVEKFNNHVAILTGYKMYREQGLTRNEAYEKARQFNHTVNYGGSRANRSIGLFSGRDPILRGSSMMAHSLMTFVVNSSLQLARYLEDGFFRPSGLKPNEIWAARKAAFQMLGTQAVLAGGLGLPFMSGVIAVIEQVFPKAEINKNLREVLAQLFGEDEEDGNVLTDMALTGVPSLFGWDFQSRLSMGNSLPGIDELNGFDPMQLAGAPINAITDFVNGGRKLVQGRGAPELLPPAIRKAVRLINDGGLMRDYKDRLVMEPTLGEKVGMFLGFNPKRMSDFNAAQRMVSLTERNSNQDEAKFRQEQANQVLQGNFGSVKAELKRRALEEPEYDVRQAVRIIAAYAEDMTFTRDLRREGSSERSKLLRSFNVPAQAPSEVDRVRFKNEVMRHLGLPPTSTETLENARGLDLLRQKYPDATRSELRRLLRSPEIAPVL